MAKGLALATAALLAACTPATADAPALPDVKTENFTVIEKNENSAIAMSEIHTETKDIKFVYLLIYFPGGFEDKNTTAVVGKVEFNCTLSQQRWGVATRLDDKAQPIGLQPPKHTGWYPVDPKADGIFSLVCGHDAQPTQEAAT
jgi:hypothetical protein